MMGCVVKGEREVEEEHPEGILQAGV